MLTPKKLDKLEKTLGDETISDLVALNSEDLKGRVLQAEQAVKQAVDELDANSEYQALVESKKDMEQGMKDVKKRQNSIIQYALHLLEEKGH